VKIRCWLRRIAWLLVLGIVLLIICYLFRAPLLGAVGRAWIVNDATTNADAIVILGGGVENRPLAAAKLYRAGVARRILYMNVRPSPAEEMGMAPSEAALTRRILLSNGVPENAMTPIGSNVASTFDESRAVKAWLEKSGAKTIMIPTDVFHTRRVRWIFGQELKDLHERVYVVPVESPRYQSSNWWQHEDGVMAFETEVFKYAFYRVHY
jgi:uncharacterized SAM-binding protein YcdF (DUF218 family)